ncbi:hypothetical protein C8F04DRAFT_1177945 [Mycena alexandri]|uniref:Uncharacterized protein n=1 Tax=Mycena alexandri TaxID=1745969 RepID=A0AAD6T7H1_9AGAR|nr:hypothetical protein C8F04DRAFT_1177945 [Mycena alexandri]
MARKRKANISGPQQKKIPTAHPLSVPKPKECSFCHDLITKHLVQHERICKINSIARRQAATYRLGQAAQREQALDAAREGNVRFHTTRVSIEFDGRDFGGTYEVEIQFRDPWEVMKRWLCDETLVPVSTWFSQERYLCLDGKIDFSNPLYEEPCSGTTWGAVDDALPRNDKYPACYVPGHIWLDKGLVSTKVKMHPFLLRGCWIHSATQNGSGNGGAALLGFFVMPAALREIDPKTLKGVRRIDYDALKRKIYHTVCRVVMASLECRSRNGEAVRFGDGVTRVAHPGILIESMDFEEMAAWLAIRNSRSNHPCPKCLVHHEHLHKLFKRSEDRTSYSMKCVIRRAKNLNTTEREELLKSHGLHNFKHFLWTFNHSDPYAAASYDLLHYFDHVWVLIKEYLQSNGLASKFNDYPHPTRYIRYNENEEVHEVFGKDFNFLKQHSLTHAIEDFMAKGTSRNMNTRVSEGFQQEVEKMYQKTNGKNAERQIGLQDEREAAMARVKMAIDEWHQHQRDTDLEDTSETSSGHWRLGSPMPRVSAHALEVERKSDPAFRNSTCGCGNISGSIIRCIKSDWNSKSRFNNAGLFTWTTSPELTGEALEIFYAAIPSSTVLQGLTR